MIVQYQQPDQYFDALQQESLLALMAKWREGRDQGESLADEEQAQLKGLIEMELLASAARTEAIVDILSQ